MKAGKRDRKNWPRVSPSPSAKCKELGVFSFSRFSTMILKEESALLGLRSLCSYNALFSPSGGKHASSAGPCCHRFREALHCQPRRRVICTPPSRRADAEPWNTRGSASPERRAGREEENGGGGPAAARIPPHCFSTWILSPAISPPELLQSPTRPFGEHVTVGQPPRSKATTASAPKACEQLGKGTQRQAFF